MLQKLFDRFIAMKRANEAKPRLVGFPVHMLKGDAIRLRDGSFYVATDRVVFLNQQEAEDAAKKG